MVVTPSLVHARRPAAGDAADDLEASLYQWYKGQSEPTMKRRSLIVAVVISISFLPVVASTAQQTNTLPNGAKYIGDMKDGEPSGRGTERWPNGGMYEGEFRHGIPNGKGTLTWPDGTKFVGQVRRGKPHGQGVYKSPDGTNAEGKFRYGSQYRTSGTNGFPDGTIEIGTWNRDGSRSGGIIRWKDGRRYEGDWKVVDGAPELPDGHGKMTYPDGKVEEGLWKDGKFIGAEKP
jgi:hypothetical protein